MVEAGQSFLAAFSFQLPLLQDGEYCVVASVADGDYASNVQHHWLHDACIFRVSDTAVRWGLVGVPMKAIQLEIIDD